jgi:uncharacterized protein HemX
MTEPTSSPPSDYCRLAAQRNAAFASALLLTAVLICAGWTIEVHLRRNAEIYRAENAALHAGIDLNRQALAANQGSLLQTQETLKRTEGALRQTQEALRETQEALSQERGRR